MSKQVVFNMDRTLTLVGDRVKCLDRNPPDWDEFYERYGEDEPNQLIVDLCCTISNAGHQIWIVTGRRESEREQTRKWLFDHGVRTVEGLIMRPNGDFRHDTIVKPERLKAAGVVPYMIFEDQSSMVDKWRMLGFPCLQVAPGDF